MSVSHADVFKLKGTPKEAEARLHLYFSQIGSGSVTPVHSDENAPNKKCKGTSCKKDFQKTAMLMGLLPGLPGFFNMGDIAFTKDELFTIMNDASDNLEADIKLNTSSLEWQKTLIAYNDDGSHMTREQLDHSDIDQTCVAVTTYEDYVTQQSKLSQTYAAKSELDQTHLALQNGKDIDLESLSNPVQALLREQKGIMPELEKGIALNQSPASPFVFNN